MEQRRDKRLANATRADGKWRTFCSTCCRTPKLRERLRPAAHAALHPRAHPPPNSHTGPLRRIEPPPPPASVPSVPSVHVVPVALCSERQQSSMSAQDCPHRLGSAGRMAQPASLKHAGLLTQAVMASVECSSRLSVHCARSAMLLWRLVHVP